MATALEAYFDDIRRHPVLSREAELKLTRRYRRTRSPAVAAELATANLRLVVKIAREYRWSHQELSDLIAEGNTGLVLAIERFEPKHGARLSTYAVFWIRAYIMRFIMRNWRLVRVGTTVRQRRIMAKLRGIETELAKIGEPGMSDIALALGVDEQEVAALRRHIGAPELPIDSPSRASNGACLADILAGNDRPDVTAEEHELASLVRSVVSDVERDLDARDRQILRARWFGSDTVTLQEIGARFGVTRERARQLERRVLDRLRAAMDERGVTRLAA